MSEKKTEKKVAKKKPSTKKPPATKNVVDAGEIVMNAVTPNSPETELPKVELPKTEIEKSIEKVETQKVSSKKLDREDLVMVASIKSGNTSLRSTIPPYSVYEWDKFGQVVEVPYGVLEALRASKKETPFKEFLYVLNQDACKQLGLERIYSQIGDLVELERLFLLNVDEFIQFVSSAPEKTKQILREILTDKLERKEQLSVFNLQVWAEQLNLDFDLSDFRR